MPTLCSLPTHLALAICDFLEVEQFGSLGSSCKRSRDVLESSYAWRQLYNRSDVHNPVLRAGGATDSSWKELVMYDKLFRDRFSYENFTQHPPTSVRKKLCVRLAPDENLVCTTEARSSTALRMLPPQGPATTYTCDRVFDSSATNADVFEQCGRRPVACLIAGVDSATFLHGQAGTGKTHTMFGPPRCTFRRDDPSNGLVPRMLYAILDALPEDDYDYTLHLSCVWDTIYAFDCLGETPRRFEPAHRMCSTDTPAFHIRSEADVAQAVNSILKYITCVVRWTRWKCMRLHRTMQIRLSQNNGAAQRQSVAEIVELAGCGERTQPPNAKAALEEMKAVNASLVDWLPEPEQPSETDLCDELMTELDCHVSRKCPVPTAVKDALIDGRYQTIIVTASSAVEHQETTAAAISFAQKALRRPDTAMGAEVEPMDSVVQQILLTESALQRAKSVAQAAREDRMQNLRRAGHCGREWLLQSNHCDSPLIKRYTERLNALKTQLQAATA